MTVSSPPPSFLVVSECDSSFHWYISTLRTSRTPVALIAKSGSLGVESVVTVPLTWTSLPSLAASTASAPTETTAPAPSASERAVVTARPSFQNSSTTMPTISTSPMTTPPTELRRRPNHDVEVVSVKVLLISSDPEKGRGCGHAGPSNPASTPVRLSILFDRDAIGFGLACAPAFTHPGRSAAAITFR